MMERTISIRLETRLSGDDEGDADHWEIPITHLGTFVGEQEITRWVVQSLSRQLKQAKSGDEKAI